MNKAPSRVAPGRLPQSPRLTCNFGKTNPGQCAPGELTTVNTLLLAERTQAQAGLLVERTQAQANLRRRTVTLLLAAFVVCTTMFDMLHKRSQRQKHNENNVLI
jgi:hypothetical protein